MGEYDWAASKDLDTDRHHYKRKYETKLKSACSFLSPSAAAGLSEDSLQYKGRPVNCFFF
jgi:hypothetical protein